MSNASKHEFLKAKALNFRTLLQSYSPEPEVVSMLSGFNEIMLLPTIQTVLIPLKNANKLEITADQVMSKLRVPDNEKTEVRTKILRYFALFIEVAST